VALDKGRRPKWEAVAQVQLSRTEARRQVETSLTAGAV
jgi:hypothetical protein